MATLNSTAGKMRFAINVGKKITLTPRNAKMNQNVLIAKERGISYTEAKRQMDIFNSVKTTYAQAAAATKPAVKTTSVETEIT